MVPGLLARDAVIGETRRQELLATVARERIVERAGSSRYGAPVAVAAARRTLATILVRAGERLLRLDPAGADPHGLPAAGGFGGKR